ncbi:hypothetical protein Tco_0354506 [Tanacetum coccineum]
MMMMMSRKRIYTSYRKKVETKQLPLLCGLTCPRIGSANGVVESDETDEWDESVLVPISSKASNSSPIRGTLEPTDCNSSTYEGASSESDSVSVSTSYACLTAT